MSGVNTFVLFILLFILTCIVGWVANVVQIVLAISEPITGLYILKCVGVLLAPLGVVLGYIGMF
jgi:hypothetical protein